MPTIPERLLTKFRMCIGSKKHNVGYVFIPKCGSTSVKVAFGEEREGIYWYYDKFPDETKQMMHGRSVFTILRNPMSRVVSGYMEANIDRIGLQGLAEYRALWKLWDTPVIGFRRYLDMIEKVWFDPHALPQCYFLNLAGIQIQHYFAFESMSHQVGTYLGQYGLALPARHYQKTRKPARAASIVHCLRNSPELRMRIKRLYANDFALYRSKIGGR